MTRTLRFVVTLFAIVGLAGIDGSALAQPKDQKNKDQREQSDAKGKTDDKQKKVKQHKHHNGKDLVGDKIKKDGTHKIKEHGKFAASVNVTKGKIAGVSVKHAEKGDVPVTKYKTTKKMARGPMSGVQLASLVLAQEYVGTIWIGYAYYDDYGDEIIYWFPYDMILDGDTGAIDFYPAY